MAPALLRPSRIRAWGILTLLRPRRTTNLAARRPVWQPHTDMDPVQVVTLLCALGAGTIGGFFFAFSVCVMAALSRQPAPQAIATMQAINIVVLNPLFLGAFLGTAALCVIVSGLAVLDWDGASSACLLAGSALYVLGSFFVTMRFNVPRNDALAAVSPDSAEGQRVWSDYLSSWTAWNHVRCVASLGAGGLFGAASTI